MTSDAKFVNVCISKSILPVATGFTTGAGKANKKLKSVALITNGSKAYNLIQHPTASILVFWILFELRWRYDVGVS